MTESRRDSLATNRLGHWNRGLASLRTRTLKRSQSSEPSIDLTNEALDLHAELLTELAGALDECDQLRAEAQTRFLSWGQLLNVMPMGCLVTDNTGQIRRANAAAARIFNISAKHLAERHLVLFSHDRVAFAATISRLRAGDRHVQFQLRLRPRDRKLASFDAVIVASVEEDATYLWFLVPIRERGDDSTGMNGDVDEARRSIR